MGVRLGGRAKGTPNKATADVRAAVALIAAEKAPLIGELFDQVAAQDPARAVDLYLRLIEYHIPKLARSEVTGQDGGPLIVEFPPLPGP